ncbi:MAG: hypothetical protein LBU25_00875 [Treponema sp.]|nr:hypothetical protein [Treponema sp.]
MDEPVEGRGGVARKVPWHVMVPLRMIRTGRWKSIVRAYAQCLSRLPAPRIGVIDVL